MSIKLLFDVRNYRVSQFGRGMFAGSLCERLQEAGARNISFYSLLVSSLRQSVKLMDLVEIVGTVEHISSHF